LDLVKTGLPQQGLDGLRLIVPMLQQQPSTRLQVTGGLVDQGPDIVQPILATDQGLPGLVA
jgi:hypothetical protein